MEGKMGSSQEASEASAAAGIASGRFLPWMETVTGRDGESAWMEPGTERSLEARAAGPAAAAGERWWDQRPRHDRQASPRVPAGTEGKTELPLAAGSLVGLIHDARNMVTAIELYCDLLAGPGVLTEDCRHYAGELRLVSTASRRLLERLAGIEGDSGGAREPRFGALPPGYAAPQITSDALPVEDPLELPAGAEASFRRSEAGRDLLPRLARSGRMQGSYAEPVLSLADELRANLSLLAAVAGHGVTVGLAIAGGNAPVQMTREDLTRVLVNLTRNAAEAMPGGGHLQIALDEIADTLRLKFSDTGSGIAPEAVDRIFLPGYTTHLTLDDEASSAEENDADWASAPGSGGPSRIGSELDLDASGRMVPHRGLGLAIVRSLVSSAKGTVSATNRKDGPGAVFTVQFPLPGRAG